ncbi:hypothetical protein [Acetobacter fallax]|uniref:Uncharacterized protein n=1 Tax=Acetobacter fallax TaxID=1737473 RepID=A0ABX0K892_9PROT|nr:hypothetical protein [Acetobacter fallax]NHO32018.1 hypothetical protein [Acetobacter fallax]NHO35466.1 hypothetical protein [Acetobacter fallax]
MAVGDQDDIAARIRAVLPAGWFPDVSENATPVLDGLLAGLAWPWAMFFRLLSYAKLQSRLQTSTGNFIDMAASDYFGDGLPRFSGEADSAYIARIQNEFLVKRNTRAALEYQMSLVVADALIFEPWRAPDCTCTGRDSYGSTQLRYGSRTAPGTVFVECPIGTNRDNISKLITETKSEGIDVFVSIPNN